MLSSVVKLFLLHYIKLDKHLSDLEDLEKNGGDNFKNVLQKIKLIILKTNKFFICLIQIYHIQENLQFLQEIRKY